MQSHWPDLAAAVLGRAPEVIAARGATDSFVELGGTSLQATEFVALAERKLRQSIDLAGLLSRRPFAEAVGEAAPYTPVVAPAGGHGLRPLLPEQGNLLGLDTQVGGTANHLLFTAEADGELEEAALAATLATLTRRHEALRTVFVRHRRSARRRVLPRWQPRLLVQRLVPAAGDDPVSVVQSQLASASAGLLDPYEQPPVVFMWTQVAGRGHLVSLLLHHTAFDGWAAGLFWSEFAALYAAGGHDPQDHGPSPEVAVARHRELISSGRLAELTRNRVAQLADVPDVLELPTDLVRPGTPDPKGVRFRFGLGAAARDAVQELAKKAGVTRGAVLLTAWGLALARRAGVDDFLLAMASSGRPTADLQDVVAVCTKVVPVRITLDRRARVVECVGLTSTRIAEAIVAQDVPFGQLVLELGKVRHFESLPFPMFCFAAHDDLVPEALPAGPVTFTLHEGYCGGTVFDATLFVQRWGDSPRLALEYKPSALTPIQAAGLAEALDQTLVDMARDPQAPLEDVRGISVPQRLLLERLREGPPGSTAAGPWGLVEEHAVTRGAAPAIRAPDAELSYAGLVEAVAAHASAIARVGVGIGDRVAVAVPRSSAEVVAVLAALRQGAAYVAVDPESSDGYLRQVLGRSAPRALVAAGAVAQRLSAMAPHAAVVAPWTPGTAPEPRPVPAAPTDPERVAYVAFTSGSTGQPKGVMVPNRGIVRLVHHVDYMPVEPGEGYLRLAPLAFDASTLEIFAPLLAGAVIEVYPAGPVSTSGLAEFLRSRETENVFLTAGLFRLQVDHRPDGFAAVRHVMTGGDVVPATQVRALLREFPGLRVSNFYGPTENSVVTTAFTATDPSQVVEPLPIGGAIPTTSVLVLDESRRLVPPGGVGELYTGGGGLAVGYLGMPEETTAQFDHREPDHGQRLYRTGDLVRWDDSGRLRFLGRRDQQIKISGYRIEPDAVAARLRTHPAVRDAVVAGTTGDAASRRLVAGVAADPVPDLVADLRGWVAQTLPDYAVPALWAIVDELPVTPNGKVDVRALEEAAQGAMPGEEAPR